VAAVLPRYRDVRHGALDTLLGPAASEAASTNPEYDWLPAFGELVSQHRQRSLPLRGTNPQIVAKRTRQRASFIESLHRDELHLCAGECRQIGKYAVAIIPLTGWHP